MKLLAVVLLLTSIAQDPVQERLEKSPRHHEWVKLKVGERTLHSFVVFPEVKGKVPAVIVIHENRGLNDWARAAADRFAEAGYIAIAPDLLSGHGPKGGRTSDFENSDKARTALYGLKPDAVTADLNAAADHVRKLDSCNGKIAVAGFCWGGSQTFRFATNRKDLSAAFVFYGRAPTGKDDFARIACPVYGFYGESDNRINATLPDTKKNMKEAKKTFDPVIYDGAGHAFMRRGESAKDEDANRKAMLAAWKRLKEILGKM